MMAVGDRHRRLRGELLLLLLFVVVMHHDVVVLSVSSSSLSTISYII
jgi:hypothetical protein